MDYPEVVHVLLYSAYFQQAAELDHLVLQTELEALLRLRHDEPDSDEKGVATLEVVYHSVRWYVRLFSLERSRVNSELGDVFLVIEELEEPAELAFHIAEPANVGLVVVTENVNLDEMVEFLEKPELLEKASPLVAWLNFLFLSLLLVLIVFDPLLLDSAGCKCAHYVLRTFKLLDYGLEGELSHAVS